jgi:MFS family permease
VRNESHEPSTPAQRSAARAALAHRNFRIVFAGSFVSSIGQWLRLVVFAAYAYNATHSAAFVGQIAFAFLAPVFVVGIPIGMLIDRTDRRRALVGIAGLQGLVSVLLALAVSHDSSRLVLLLIALMLGVAMAAAQPAYFAVLPALVGQEDLAGAISLNSASQNASRVVGPIVAGVLLAYMSPAGVFLISAVLMLAVIVSLFFVPPMPPPGTARVPVGIREAFAAGFRAGRANRIVWRSLVTMAIFSFVCLYFVNELPVVATHNLGMSTNGIGYGLFYAFFGAGAVIGAVANSTVFTNVPVSTLVRHGLLAFGATMVLFSLSNSIYTGSASIMTVGAAYLVFATALATALQQAVADEERGRVGALWGMAYAGCVGLGNLALGPIVDRVGVRPVLLAGAAVSVLLWFYADLRPREVGHAVPQALPVPVEVEVP